MAEDKAHKYSMCHVTRGPKSKLKCSKCDYFDDAWNQGKDGLIVCPKCGTKHDNRKKCVLYGGSWN